MEYANEDDTFWLYRVERLAEERAWIMRYKTRPDEGDHGGDETGGVREPRRPRPAPPSLNVALVEP